MQVCILLQTDNHANTPPLSFLQAGCPSCHPTNSVKALKAFKKNKQNVNKNNVEYILHLHLVNITWCHPGWHYNVTPWSGEHLIMLSVTWRRFDQSAKQLIIPKNNKIVSVISQRLTVMPKMTSYFKNYKTLKHIEKLLLLFLYQNYSQNNFSFRKMYFEFQIVVIFKSNWAWILCCKIFNFCLKNS